MGTVRERRRPRPRSDLIDYLHIAKFNGRWVIVSVLWELKPPKK